MLRLFIRALKPIKHKDESKNHLLSVSRTLRIKADAHLTDIKKELARCQNNWILVPKTNIQDCQPLDMEIPRDEN